MLTIKNAALRKAIRILVPFVLIPGLVLLSGRLLREKQYAVVSLIITILALFLFFAGYEKKKTGNRRMVIIAVMVTLSVVGRFIPVIKPVTALTVLTAMYLGGEAGFLTGALSAVISNFYFGQGPWTPFQMFAWGMIGLVAGFLADPLRRNRVFLLIFGALAGVWYSFLMDIWSMLWMNGSFSLKVYLGALVTAIPYTIMYAVSNVIFLWIFAKPFGEKLSRVKIKYGV